LQCGRIFKAECIICAMRSGHRAGNANGVGGIQANMHSRSSHKGNYALRVPRVLAVLALASTLSACTPMQWQRDGLALDYNDSDWGDCRRQSIGNANRWMFEPFPRTFIGRDARGRPFSYVRPSPYPSRFMLEQEYLDNCLRARGFRRVPLQPADAATPSIAE
jgi:hypothetical protein